MTTRATTATPTRATTAASSHRRTPRPDRRPAIALASIAVAAAALFGGVYAWSAGLLAAAALLLLLWTRRPRIITNHDGIAVDPWLRRLDLSIVLALAGIAVQLIPLPAALLSVIVPARVAFAEQSSLAATVPAMLPITLDRSATVHAWLAAWCMAATFWTARAIFTAGGVRTFTNGLAWGAVALVLAAVAQAATDAKLIYGVWQPNDLGARPLGPFVNRNHFGTWTLLAFFLAFGCLQWRRTITPPLRGSSWRAHVSHALDGRRMILVLAQVLLGISVAVGASRSTMLALACGAGYVAGAAPRGRGTGRSTLRAAAIGVIALLAIVAYADVDRVLSRIDETRELGLARRTAIWRDAARVVEDFPVTGVGAGSFASAMRIYQTSDRTYFWNEAHNQYVQVASEGGLLLAAPAASAAIAFVVLAIRRLRRRDDPMHWMRLGASAALVAVAVQSIWETGLSLPANGMLAAIAAAVVIHSRPEAPAPLSVPHDPRTQPGWNDAPRD